MYLPLSCDEDVGRSVEIIRKPFNATYFGVRAGLSLDGGADVKEVTRGDLQLSNEFGRMVSCDANAILERFCLCASIFESDRVVIGAVAGARNPLGDLGL